MDIKHETIEANGIPLHVASLGSGPPLLLMHGWPEFWLTWEPIMRRLAGSFTLIAPDFRGFGASGKGEGGPSDHAGADVHAADMLALLDRLGIEQIGFVAHDVGASVGQSLARLAPARFTKLFFFGCPYPGIGARWNEPGHLKEIWYQSFHQQPFAPALVGATRASCAAYIGHFLRHWAGRPDAFDDVFEAFVDNFMQPGNLQGGFNWYRSANADRLAIMRADALAMPQITIPTRVRWGDRDPLMPYGWSDRLGETFTDLDLAPIPCGHFPHREDPDRAASEIRSFFEASQGS